MTFFANASFIYFQLDLYEELLSSMERLYPFSSEIAEYVGRDYLPLIHDRRAVHVLTEYAVALFRIIYKYMGHCSGKLSVLNDRATAHSLYDAAGLFQQFLSVTVMVMFFVSEFL